MSGKIAKNFKLIVLVTIVLFAGSFIFHSSAQQNSIGWLWGGSEDGDLVKVGARMGIIDGNESGLGWVSLSSSNLNSKIPYNLNVPQGDGEVSGYGWSENVGWLSFNRSDLSGCPVGRCVAERKGDELIGWARILSLPQAGDNAGGWQGWISLNKKPGDKISYGVKIKKDGCSLDGYAWSDEFGWIDFSKATICSQGPNLFVVLNVDPSSGEEPLDAILTAKIGGTAIGESNYKFWCDYQKDKEPDFQKKSLKIQESVTCKNLKAGVYHPKVIVERGGLKAEADALINVYSKKCSPSCGNWTNWSKCSAECGGGVQTRTRVCIKEDCSTYNETQSQTCNTGPCVVKDFDLSLNPNSIYLTILRKAYSKDSTHTKITIKPRNGFNSRIRLMIDEIRYEGSGGQHHLMSEEMEERSFHKFHFNKEELKVGDVKSKGLSLSSKEYTSGIDFYLTAKGNIQAGVYKIRIKASGGGLVRTGEIILNVEVLSPGFREF